MLHQRTLLSIAMALTLCSGVLSSTAVASKPNAAEIAEARRFVAAKFLAPQSTAPRKAGLFVAENNGPIGLNKRGDKPLKIVDKEFARGLACHATSKVVVQLPSPGKRFFSQIGLDNNEQTASGRGSIVFSANVGGRNVFRSDVFKVATPTKAIEVDLKGARSFVLEVGDAGDGIGWDQAVWADAHVKLANGKTVWLGDLPILDVQDGLFSFDPPFSFTYNGKPSSEFLGTWKVKRSSKKLDDHRTGHTVVYSDPAGGLSVRCEAVEYDDFPTVEWKLFFKNTGSADTPIIENIQSLDVRWQRPAGNEFLLHHNIGSVCGPQDYSPLETVLGGSVTKRIAAAGGKSTNTDLSYFNLERGKDNGLIVVVGWPGQWAADFIRDADQGLHIRAGQELTHFKLLPNEEVRTPLSVLQFWKGGDWIRAQNVWRRWMIAHNIPRPGGEVPPPMLLGCSSGAYGEMIGANEENQIMFIDGYLAGGIKLDYWWMDAGWYPQQQGWQQVGTWEVDKARFPRGLRAVSDHAHAKDVKTLLWFEPERVAANTWLSDNHPEWILGGKDGGILNIGNPETLEWLIEHVDKLLVDQGINLYRQDFNIDPLDFWRNADAADRQGITEIRHIEGLLTYWDELHRRHPEMLFDECAGGGRRNDLEMMRRGVPLWRSDKTIEPMSQQCITYGIASWIPYFGTGTAACANSAYYVQGKTPVEPYAFWSTAVPSLNLLFDVREKGLEYDKIRQLTTRWREIMPYYYGDYYPLTRTSQNQDVWVAWQFDRPDRGDGIVQAFRRPDCIYESARLKLRGLDPKTRYVVQRIDIEDKPSTEPISGEELMQKGLPLSIEERPGAVVIKYQTVSSTNR